MAINKQLISNQTISKQAMDEYFRLYKKHIDGMRWLEQRSKDGFDITQDEADFIRLVREPMRKAWDKLTAEEQQHCIKIDTIVEKLNARIV
ncbi:MAG: hypothetical protein RBU23_05055 [Candidatus Auribacterota bacterium]|jgi:hypothetical protein|nr:hypothetical protein [Candidatus Auribacterota bacterium]